MAETALARTKGQYLGCMNAETLDWDRIVYPVAFEDKIDGLRFTFVAGAGYTRNGNIYESVRPFAEIFHRTVGLDDVHVDAEMVADNWNQTSKLVKRTKDIDTARIHKEVTCNVFDAFGPETLGDEPYLERRKAITWLVTEANLRFNPIGYRIKLVPSGLAYTREDLEAAFADARSRRHEGLMIKTLGGVYEIKRSFAWAKWKPDKDITVTIVGGEHAWNQCPKCMPKDVREARTGDKSRTKKKGLADQNCETCKGAGQIADETRLGAFLCKTADGEDMKVGGGLTLAQRKEFWTTLPQLVGRKIDVKVQDDTKGNDIVARHPNFTGRFRDDL